MDKKALKGMISEIGKNLYGSSMGRILCSFARLLYKCLITRAFGGDNESLFKTAGIGV